MKHDPIYGFVDSDGFIQESIKPQKSYGNAVLVVLLVLTFIGAGLAEKFFSEVDNLTATHAAEVQSGMNSN